MELKNITCECFVLIFLICFNGALCFFEDDYDDTPSFGRCPWIRNKLKNGRVKIRSRGRIAKFLCDPGYELAGKRFATCVRGQWNNPIPVCVARGCSRVPTVTNGRLTEMYRGALLVYDCNPGYTLDGVVSIYCDGRRWSTDPPTCIVSATDPDTECDFEDPDLCGWNHDPTHDFDWKRNQFSTPSGHVGTGPSFDHTFGPGKGGFYLYLEASSPRKVNDTSRLFSPVYPFGYSGGCFVFWYHMYGATTGGLRVYIKPESHVFGEVHASWEMYGDQGNEWRRGNIDIQPLHEHFQVVIEGIRGTSYVGDTAIDDVKLVDRICESLENTTEPVAHTIAESCRGRCREPDEESSCGCNENCYVNDNCCNDYATICTTVSGNDTSADNPDEVGDEELVKTSSPVTVTITRGTTIDRQSSTTETLPLSAKFTRETESEFTTTSTESTHSTSVTTTTNTTTKFPTTAAPTVPSTSVASTTVTYMPSTYSSSLASTILKTTSIESTVKSSSVTTSISSTIPTSTTTIRTTRLTPSTTTTTTSTRIIPATPTTTSTLLTTMISKELTSTVSSSSSLLPMTAQATTISTAQTSASVIIVPTSISYINISSPSTQSTTDSTTVSTRKIYNLRPRSTTIAIPISSALQLNTTTPISSSSKSTFHTYSSTALSPVSNTSVLVLNATESKPFITSDITRSYSAVTFGKSSSTAVTTQSTSTSTRTIPSTTLRTTTSRKIYHVTDGPRSTYHAPKYTQTYEGTTFKSRENHASKLESTSNGNHLTVTIISILIVSGICIAGGLFYYFKKQKSKRQSKLSDDSEMRFLSENEVMEYSDASALDKILIK